MKLIETPMKPTVTTPRQGAVVRYNSGAGTYTAVVLAARKGRDGVPITDLWVVTDRGPEGGIVQLGVPHKMIQWDQEKGLITGSMENTWAAE